MGIFNWSKTAGSNTTLEGISTGTGMAPNVFDNWVRAVSAALKSWQEDTGGALVSGGSSNAYTLTTNSTLPSLADGACFKFIANHANTGAATLNVDGLGAKAIRKGGDVALASGDMPSGMLCEVGYDASANGAAGAWLLISTNPTSFYSTGGTDIALADGGTGASLADPNADRIMFWDDSAGAVTWLAPSTGLAITTTDIAVDKATAAQVRDATSNKVLTSDLIESASALVTLAYGASYAIDWDSFITGDLTLTGNISFIAPTNAQPGTWRTIRLIQDATGSRTATWDGVFKFAGGTDMVLTTTASAVDVISILCVSASVFYVFPAKGMA